jgi:hypothetical protein
MKESMKATVRPVNPRCKCGASFKLVNYNAGYICEKCKALPARFRVDMWSDGKRIRFYRDEEGQPLDSYVKAIRLHSRTSLVK